ncbi:MAG TPA: ribosome biogenesis GTP-binding protein YihA/YsxC [Syntrophales bacterium]|nr:ribosome biogenesis GTP-binding protein YihA/YsxC [Syntrophales bacterium]
MKILSANFVKSAVEPSHYPAGTLPEIAFAGKSNVGKSSMINVLSQRKGLAKTSNSPGRTQLINFFNINDQFSFVDLPGYGYAKVPVAVRKNWGPMVETYLKERRELRLVIFIMDIRRNPDINDIKMLRWFDYYRIPYLLALTKIDKISRNQTVMRRRVILDSFKRPALTPVLFSAKTGAGRDELWGEMEKFIFEVRNNNR